MPWVTLVVGAIGALAGWFWLDGRTKADRAAAALAWAPGVGLGTLSLLTFFSVFVGSRWAGSWLFLLLVPALGAVVYWRRGRRRPLTSSGDSGLRGRRSNRATALLVLLALVTVTSLGLAYVEFATSRPHGSADAVNIWVSRSLMVFGAPDDLPNRLALLKKGHPDYPMMLPTALAGQYALADSTDLSISRVTGLLFVLGLGGMAFFALDRLVGRFAAVAAAALIWVTPAVLRWGFSQVADVPLAYLSLGAAVGLGAQLRDGEKLGIPPVLAGLFLGLLPWTKNEGSAVALALVLALGLVLWRHGADERGAWKRLPWVALGAAPGVLATILFKGVWVVDKELGKFFRSPVDHLLDLERWQTLISALGSALAPGGLFERWGLAWAFVLVAAAVVLVRRRREVSSGVGRLLEMATLLTLGAYGLAYLLSPYELEWHVNQSVDRLLVQVFPLALMAASLGLGSLFAEAPQAAAASAVDSRKV